MDESEEDDPDKLPPFRWNWQAVFMVGFTAAALAIPLLGVVSLLQGYVNPAPAPKSVPTTASKAAENPGLRSALERASDTAMAAAPIPDERPALNVPVATEAERAPKIARLRQIVSGQGGTVLEMEAGRRFVVSGSPALFSAVSHALVPDAPKTSAAAPQAELFEVRFP